MLLLIDNYDSFSYNLYQLIGEVLLEEGRTDLQNPENPDIRVIRNDELSVEEIAALHPDGIIISPGPGRPADAGICEALVKAASLEVTPMRPFQTVLGAVNGPENPIREKSPSRISRADVAKDTAPGIGSEQEVFRWPPILGVCLGEQGICEALGAQVTYAKELMHGKQSIATLDLTSPLFAGLGEKIPVARYHSLAVDATTLPEELTVTATADDGEVMAVEHRTRFIFGVQFHPESIITPDGKDILRNFVKLTENTTAEENQI
jgi:anthranilate synthase component 2